MTRALIVSLLLCSLPAFAQSVDADGVPDDTAAAAKEQAGKVDPGADKNAEVTAEDAKKATDIAKELRAKADAQVKEADAAEAEAKRLADVVARRGFWWTKSLNVGVTSSLLFSDSFVGQTDGWTAQAGLLMNGGFVLGYNGFELRNAGRLNESFISTPAIGSWAIDDFSPVFLKAADVAEWETVALYTFPGFPYVGPYARGKASSQALPGYTYFADTTSVSQPGAGSEGSPCGPLGEGGTSPKICTYDGGVKADRLNLTSMFEPLILEQAVGAVILPPAFPPWINYDFKLGLGARQVVARDFFFLEGQGGYVISDDAGTPEVDLKQLFSVASAGLEGKAAAGGQVFDRLSWNVGLSLYYPLAAYSQPDGAYFPGFDAEKGAAIAPIGIGPVEFENQLLGPLHVDFESLLGLKLTEWLTINWSNRLRREPFVLTKFQFQSQLLVAVGYSLF